MLNTTPPGQQKYYMWLLSTPCCQEQDWGNDQRWIKIPALVWGIPHPRWVPFVWQPQSTELGPGTQAWGHLLRVQLIVLDHGWRHQGKRKAAKWWASCNWLWKEKGKYGQLVKVSGELPLSFQKLALWLRTAGGFMHVPAHISRCWSLNTRFFSLLGVQTWCRDVLLLCFLLDTSHSSLPEYCG